MKKRLISVSCLIVFIVSMLLAFEINTYAASVDGTLNQVTYVRMSPYYTAETVEILAAGTSIKILERDYAYLYVSYNNGAKRGYVPRTFTDATGYSWCSHGIFSPGYNSTSSAVTVRYAPSSTSNSCGTIDANEGEIVSKPLLVLREENGYYFIQYTTNTSATGSTQPLYKRGWVSTSSITVKKVAAAPVTGVAQKVVICNTQLKYLTATSSSTIAYTEATGEYNQQWILRKLDYSGSAYYRIESVEYGTCLEVKDSTAVLGNNIFLDTINTAPDKSQEFALQSINRTEPFGIGVRILTRCSGNFLGIKYTDGVFSHVRQDDDYTSLFFIDPIDNQWNGAYIRFGTSLTYRIDPSAIVGNLSEKLYTDAIDNWKGLSKVSLNRVTSGTSEAITFKTMSLDEVPGITCPRLNSSGQEYKPSYSNSELNTSWYDVTIFLNSDSKTEGCVTRLSQDNIKKIITHEIGHALKLQHPHYITVANGKITIDYIPSVMNQGSLAEENVSPVPTEFDIQSLQIKWGK